MAEPNDSGSDTSLGATKVLITTTEQAAIQNLTSRLSQIEADGLKYEDKLQRVRTQLNQVVIGVLLIFFLTIGAVAVEATLFHTRENREITDFQKEYYSEMARLKESHKSLQSLTNSLRDSLARNLQIRSKLANEVLNLKEQIRKLSKRQ